ncbi:MAG: hypothetical protein ACI81O_002085, partial [Cyclobacteriaceae bacterium]
QDIAGTHLWLLGICPTHTRIAVDHHCFHCVLLSVS